MNNIVQSLKPFFGKKPLWQLLLASNTFKKFNYVILLMNNNPFAKFSLVSILKYLVSLVFFSVIPYGMTLNFYLERDIIARI